jgi:hypothetical protein
MSLPVSVTTQVVAADEAAGARRQNPAAAITATVRPRSRLDSRIRISQGMTPE